MDIDKDKRIVRQNLLNRAFDAWVNDKIEVKDPHKELPIFADGFMNYIYNGLDGLDGDKGQGAKTTEDVNKEPALPLPSSKEKAYLLSIYEKLFDDVCTSDGIKIDKKLLMKNIIERWGEYPNDKKTVNLIIKSIRIEDIV